MKKYKKVVVLIGIGVLLLFLYYCNNTYILNFFDDRFPFLIRRYYNIMIDQMENPKYDFGAVFTNPRIISMLLFSILISIFHYYFIDVWFQDSKSAKIFVYHILAFSLLIIPIYFLHTLFPASQKFYIIARIIKDYIQSPISLVLFIMLWRFYNIQSIIK